MCVYLLYSLLHWHSPSIDTLYLKNFGAKIFLSVYPATEINLWVSFGAPKIFSLCKTGRGHLAKVHSDPHSIVASLSGCRPSAHTIMHRLWKSWQPPIAPVMHLARVCRISPGYFLLRPRRRRSCRTNSISLRRIQLNRVGFFAL